MQELPLIERGYSTLLQTEVVSKSVPTDNDDLIINEAFVGLFGTNTLLSLTPNFMQVYSYLLNGNCKINDKSQQCSTIYTKYINGINFADFFLISSLVDYKAVLLQIILALALAYEKFRFNHNDLNDSNIIIKTLNQPYNTVFNNQIISRSIYQPVIIDFGFSSIEIDGYYYTTPIVEGQVSSWQQDILMLLSVQADLNYLVLERELKNQKINLTHLTQQNDIAYAKMIIKDIDQDIVNAKSLVTLEQERKFDIHRLLYQVVDEAESMDQFFLESLQILKM